MDVPGKTSKVWEDLVTGKRVYALKFLAAKILLGRLTRAVADDPSPENVKTCAAQVHAIFANNMNMPSVQDDLKSICGEVRR